MASSIDQPVAGAHNAAARRGQTVTGIGVILQLLAEHRLLLVAWLVVFIAGIPSLNFAFGPDQALFMYMGRAIARGQRLYVDVWDVKPPGIFWTYAPLAALTTSARVLRTFDLLYTMLSIAAIYALGRLWWSAAVGAVAGLLFGLVYVTGSGYWNMAQPDSFMVLPVVLGVMMWELRSTGRAGWHALAAGVLFGWAFQFRPVVLLLPAVLLAVALVYERPRRMTWQQIALFALGGVAVEAVVLTVLVFGNGVGEYLFAQLRFARHYSRLGGPYAYDGFSPENFLSGFRGSVMWFFNSRLLLTGPSVAALAIGGAVRGDRALRLCGLLLLAAVLSVAVQAKFFVYHWHIALPLLALLAGWAFVELARSVRPRHSPVQSGTIVAATAGLLLLVTPQVTDGGLGEWRDLLRFVREPGYRTRYYDRFGLRNHGAYSFLASEEVANYVRAHSNEGDTLVVWGYDPNAYLMSGRDSASRFSSFLPLMPVFAPENWKTEFANDIRTKRPAYIAVQRGENARWITGRADDSAEWIVHYKEFFSILENDYQFDLRIEDYELYRLK